MNIFSFLVISLVICGGQSEAGEAKPKGLLSRQEVGQLMLEVDQDGQSIKKWKRLLAEPDDYVPMLIDLLSRYPENDGLVSRVCSIFYDMKSNRADIRQAVRSVLKHNLRRPEKERGVDLALAAATAVIENIGDGSDLPDIVLVLRRDSPLARGTALGALAKLGNESTIPQIEAVIEAQAAKTSPELIEKDKMYLQAFKTIGQIKYRMFLQRQQER